MSAAFTAAVALLSIIEQGSKALREIKANNQQSHEMTPEEEADLDARAAAIFASDAADPDLNA